MQAFQNKVAVVTGAASGIGRALAERCLQEGMKVVLADIEEAALAQTAEALGGNVLAVRTDVSNAADVEALARQTLNTFGAVHLLFNNAGVGAGGAIWETTADEWEWVIGVNLWGAIHGLRVFVPIMLEQNNACHIVNSASLAGLLSYHPSAPYQITKQGIVALSEQLSYSLRQRKANIDVSVLCPGVVNTRIMDAQRNAPFAEPQEMATQRPDPVAELLLQRMRQATENGMAPTAVAEQVFEAIRTQQFYILTHPQFNPAIEARLKHALQGLPPPELHHVIAYCLTAG